MTQSDARAVVERHNSGFVAAEPPLQETQIYYLHSSSTLEKSWYPRAVPPR